MKLFALGKFVILPWLRAIPISDSLLFKRCGCASVCASSRTARYCLRACVRATKSERLKRTVTCSFERTVSLSSLFFCESDVMICARDLFSREKKSKKKGKQNCKKSFLGANFLGETLDFSSDDSYENSSFSPQF